MKHLKPYIALMMFLLGTGMVKVYAQQTTPPPGTAIINQAKTIFNAPEGDDGVSIQSNTVKVIVQSHPTFSLEPDHVIKTFKGRTQSLSHVLKNKGNVSSSFELAIYNLPGDDFDLDNMAWEHQGKSKQLSDDTLRASVTLGPGEQFDFTYSGMVSSALINDQIEAVVQVEATSAQYGVTLQNTDSIKVLIGADIELQKEQIGADDIQAGDTFTYSIAGVNTGDVTAIGRDVTINSQLQKKVVLVDSVPANTSLVGFADLEKGTALFHTSGDGAFEFSMSPPADLDQVDVVAVAFDSLKVNESFEILFDVKINDGATGQIENTAEISFVDPNGNVETEAASNTVITELPEKDADIDYFTDDTFTNTTGTSTIGADLHLEAVASACNISRNEVDIATIEINSLITGDKELFNATETGPNSGRFRVNKKIPTRDGLEHEVILGNEILETVEGDELEAILNCEGLDSDNGGNGSGGSAVINARVVVDPSGIVFDSETNTPVSGAEVRIIDVNGVTNGGIAGGLAEVLDADAEKAIENIQYTNQEGKFEYPYLLPGEYRIEVNPPSGYNFASELSPDQLPEDREIDAEGSYGQTFVFEEEPQGVDFDIPLDPKGKGVLFVEKKVNKKVAEIGDFIYYTLTIRSEAVNTINDLTLYDELPFGFVYQLGSARIDGERIDNPEGGKGPDLSFSLGAIEPGTSLELMYQVYVGPGSEKGDGINTAIAESDEAIIKVSNKAQVKVEVNGGVFTDDGYIIGKVFLDCNKDGMQDRGEAGVPGVRLYLENGNYVITDGEGKYSFYAIKPNKHILKVDNYSLPKGSELLVIDNRQANDPSSRFVDLKKGEMHRADFAICNCTPAVHEEINARTKAFQSVSDQMMEKDITKKLNVDNRSNNAKNVNFDKASGTLNEIQTPEAEQIVPGTSDAPVDSAVAKADSVELNKMEWALLKAEAGLGFLNIVDGDTLTSDQNTFWVKGRRGANFVLSVNGKDTEENKIGQRSVSSHKDLQVWEFVSISLKPGINNITLKEVDPFGNERDTETIRVYAPGELHVLNVNIPVNDVSADGTSAAVVRVELLDKQGIPVGSRIPVTLDVSFGKWNAEDLNDKESGTQVFVENGRAEFELISTIEPRTVTVRAHAGELSDEAKVDFLPDLRPLIAAGIIEGNIRLRDPLNIASAKGDDGFERELKSLTYDMNNFTGDGRVSFFLKGKVSGKTLLTAGYDSEKNKEDALFRDINPDEFYPVYGESSIKGFDAQSTSRLYIRVDRNKTYALYGDFITQKRSQDRQLGDYSRAQTGVKAHLENDNMEASAFAVSSFSTNRVREFRGQGISRYELPDDDIIENSEIIEIVTYDRDQPEVILDVRRLTRFTDYAIEPFNGVITFRNPVSSVDKEFNPVFIRATYEVENDKERYFIGGIDGAVKLGESVELGANIVQDNNPQDQLTLTSGTVSMELGEKTRIVAEVANTHTESKGSGSAGRVQIERQGDKLDVTAQLGSSDKNFNNRSATLGQGRTEAKVRSRLSVTKSTNLNGEFLFSRNDTSGAETMGGVVNVQQSFGKYMNAEIGVRHSEQKQPTSGDTKSTNLRSEIITDLPFVKGASISAEYEQDLHQKARKLMAIGGDYKIKNIAKLYARHEFISSTGGRYTMSGSARRNNSVFGVDVDYMKNGQVYSEYRIDDAMDGKSGQAAIGLRNRFELSKGFGLNVGFERIFTIKGPSSNDGTAISSSVEYTANPNWKGTARAEARFSSQANTYLNTFGIGYRISPNWTFLGKNILSLNTQEGKSGLSKVAERFRVGAAYRDSYHNRFDALFRYEFKYEKNANIADEHFRAAHVMSAHMNYHPETDWTFSGRIAAKRSVEQDDLIKSASFLELVSGRLTHDINEKWDAGINASLIANSDFTIKDYGLGVEAGFLVATNLRLASGFNFFGYEDEDLAANNYTQRGVYAGFSYKFDEQIFRSLAPRRSNSILDESRYLICAEECEKPADKLIKYSFPQFKLPGITTPLVARNINYGQFYILPRLIHFNNNSTYINKAAANMLDKVASFLTNEDEYYIRLTGHTDTKSSYSYNMKLSEERAKAVRAYFVAAGVDPKKLKFEGLSYSEEARIENDRVDMAANRRVELELNIDKLNVRFIDQIEDLQVNEAIAGIGDWDYVFTAQHNAVPGAFNVSGSSFNEVHTYMTHRIGIVLHQFDNVALNITAKNAHLAEAIASILIKEGIEKERFTTRVNPELRGVRFTYSNVNGLKVYAQQDDIKFAQNKQALEMMDNLLSILRKRKDHLLTSADIQTMMLPQNLIFENYMADLSIENKAMVSRIGSFLNRTPKATIEIQYNGKGINVERAGAIYGYLVSWGIGKDRIGLVTDTTVTADQVEFSYEGADEMKLINLENVNVSGNGGE
ncbi:MAG: hypothetical protein FH748_06300 [Balneolaceae bacterium]|nr:hypothetical protein [Balneolaceae bacterium]